MRLIKVKMWPQINLLWQKMEFPYIGLQYLNVCNCFGDMGMSFQLIWKYIWTNDGFLYYQGNIIICAKSESLLMDLRRTSSCCSSITCSNGNDRLKKESVCHGDYSSCFIQSSTCLCLLMHFLSITRGKRKMQRSACCVAYWICINLSFLFGCEMVF